LTIFNTAPDLRVWGVEEAHDMSDLFARISQGSILLWNVQSDAELPKRKEMIRLLGTESFTYYKHDGHHKEYIRLLARLMNCLDPNKKEEWQSYWPRTAMSHFLFTAEKIEINSFFLLKYSSQCLGAFHVSKRDLDSLADPLRHYDQVKRFTQEVNAWPTRIQNHKDEIKSGNILDTVIENFDLTKLKQITEGYGQQAKENALANLREWHSEFFWKSMGSPKDQITLKEACTT
jgi:hypothetical protein